MELELDIVIIFFAIFIVMMFFFILFGILYLTFDLIDYYANSLRVGKKEYEDKLAKYLKKKAKDYVSQLQASTYDRLKLPIIDSESTNKSIHCIERESFLDIDNIEFTYISKFVLHNVKGKKNQDRVMDQLLIDYPRSSIIEGYDILSY
jgi:hypothetical protein